MYSGGRKEFMRNKTQILINQNYELIKQRMLTGTKGDFSETQKKPLAATVDTKINGDGFLAGIAQQQNKKRKRDQISDENKQQGGKFMYKFKEGHSKNFRRELNFDFFS